MWDYDSLIGKARRYFQRAEEHPHSDDDEFALWLILGLEYLLRAPLARVHPSLLAAAEGNSILHAVGITTVTEPRSVPSHTVIDRLGHVIPEFDGDRQKDARDLIALRNNELHTGSAALGSITNDVWLPRFARVAEVLTAYLGLSLEDLVGVEIAELGRSLVDADDKKLCAEVERRLAAAQEFHGRLQHEEIAARRWQEPLLMPSAIEVVQCPACGERAPLILGPVRTADEHVVDDEFVRDVIYVAMSMDCSVCGLELRGAAEMKCVGLPQQLRRTEREGLYDRVMQDYYAEDYGND